jgi:hypothetical protein
MMLTRQMMAAGLWRVIEFGIDGYGLPPQVCPPLLSDDGQRTNEAPAHTT